MSTYIRHQKENAFNNLVYKFLEENFNGNVLRYHDAENMAKEHLELIRKLKKINSISVTANTANSVVYQKHTHVDLKNNIVSIEYDEGPEALLAYNIDYLTVKRILPFPLTTFLDKTRAKDKKIENEKKEEASAVFRWVKDRVLNNYFSISNISLDKNSGIFRYNTSMRLGENSPTIQFITAQMEKNKIFSIPGTDLKKSLFELSKDYYSLFSYFMVFGFTEFHARCTCSDYVKKYSKRNGIANYFCPHILFSLTQLPYYLIYTLC